MILVQPKQPHCKSKVAADFLFQSVIQTVTGMV